jgi:hypothetical protein
LADAELSQKRRQKFAGFVVGAESWRRCADFAAAAKVVIVDGGE